MSTMDSSDATHGDHFEVAKNCIHSVHSLSLSVASSMRTVGYAESREWSGLGLCPSACISAENTFEDENR